MCWDGPGDYFTENTSRVLVHRDIVYATIINMKTLDHVSELVQSLLEKRGITTPEDQYKFLHPDFARDINDPLLLHDMEKAVARILQACEKNQKIVVYADYDADGIPGAVIFSDFFKKIGFQNFDIYIPHRHTEGYGLHHDAVISFIDQKIDLLITVDLGITAIDEVARAMKHNLDVIVTDHHEPLYDIEKGTKMIPEACAVVNPKLGNYPDPMLCGAAVAWKVVCALLATIRASTTLSTTYLNNVHIGWEKWLLDMVGIATLSDMVPLTNENRTLAWYGLFVLSKTKRLGLLTLFQKLYIKQQNLVEEDITFMITPRINAASRMAHPMDAFKLLATHDVLEAQMMATHLVTINDERKKLVAQTMREVNKKLGSRTIENVIVIGHPDWQAGILGLVASKISEEYKKPSFVWSRENGHIKGSCRTYGSCDMHALMSHVRTGVFMQFGGHKEAGGFTTTLDAIHDLEKELLSVYAETVVTEELTLEKKYDQEFSLVDVNMKTYRDIRRLAPFGESNPKPKFLFKNITISGIRHFGKHKEHLEIIFAEEKNQSVAAIAFFSNIETFEIPLEIGSVVSCIAHIEEQNFMGKHSIRLRIVDIF